MKRFGSQQPTSHGYSPRANQYGKRVASVRYLPSGVFLQLEAPFNRDFTDSLKASLPTKKRIWDNQDKSWYIVRDQFEKLTHLLNEYFDETILLDFPQAEVSASAYNKLYLTEDAPLEVVQAAYKALALKYHPDRGGDKDIMSNINIAYKEILGELSNGKEH